MILTLEELTRVIAAVDAIANCIPLIYSLSDCRELQPLTPIYFLTGNRHASLPYDLRNSIS